MNGRQVRPALLSRSFRLKEVGVRRKQTAGRADSTCGLLYVLAFGVRFAFSLCGGLRRFWLI